MAGVSLGFWTPSAEFNNVTGFIDRATSKGERPDPAFPLSIIPVAGGMGGVNIAHVSGAVGLHSDNAEGGSHPIFNLVIAVIGRPVLMTAPRSLDNDTKILTPHSDLTFGLGCIELRAGLVVHMDIARHWHGISAMPLPGDWIQPEALILQVEWPNSREIVNAIEKAKRSLLLDPAFSEFVQ